MKISSGLRPTLRVTTYCTYVERQRCIVRIDCCFAGKRVLGAPLHPRMAVFGYAAALLTVS